VLFHLLSCAKCRCPLPSVFVVLPVVKCLLTLIIWIFFWQINSYKCHYTDFILTHFYLCNYLYQSNGMIFNPFKWSTLYPRSWLYLRSLNRYMHVVSVLLIYMWHLSKLHLTNQTNTNLSFRHPVGTLQHKYHKCETGKHQKQCNTIQQLLFRSQKRFSFDKLIATNVIKLISFWRIFTYATTYIKTMVW
jgi:hypothetical protein